jgi:hypothetical protein
MVQKVQKVKAKARVTKKVKNQRNVKSTKLLANPQQKPQVTGEGPTNVNQAKNI